MATIEVRSTRVIPATAGQVFSLLDDYAEGHWRVLPPAFSDFRVLHGGYGEGTRIAFALTLGGQTRTAIGDVSVPEAGRVIVETYAAEGSTTSFTVDPIPGKQCKLTIATRLPVRSALTRPLEERFARKLLLPIYAEEMALIAQWAPRWYDRG